MNFEYTDEQRMIKDTVERLVKDRYDFDQRNRYAAEADGYGAEIWATLAELGLLAVPFDPDLGGVGGGPVEIMIIMEALGRALALEPYYATVVLGGGLLRHGGTAEQRAATIPGIIEGSLRLAFAHGEPQSRFDLADVQTTATRVGGRWRLHGVKSGVLHGHCADRLIVSARTANARFDPQGIGLFLIDPAAPGVRRHRYRTQDGRSAATLALEGVEVGDEALIGAPAAGLPIIERAVDEALAALCAEATGAMAAGYEMTVEYLKTRRQFGVALATHQALQHRVVDMLIAVEEARSMTLYAAMMAGAADPAQRRRAMSAAKVQINDSARLVGQELVQMHGGIGVTQEFKAGHYLKRLAMAELEWGDSDHHLAALARDGGLIGQW
ncbi:MAG: acyl-CoA dehydrogenase family protein [Gammaproteobacteria bacterium]